MDWSYVKILLHSDSDSFHHGHGTILAPEWGSNHILDYMAILDYMLVYMVLGRYGGLVESMLDSGLRNL